MIGGLSHCGEQLCCARLGGEFAPVSIKMAKDQGLPLNPTKISGLCGRLMCCLRYEVDAYNDFNSRAPRRGSLVEVSDGSRGKVSDLDAVRELVSLRFPREDMPDETITVKLCDLNCEKGGKQCRCTMDCTVLEEQRARAQEHNSTLLVGNARFLDNAKLTGEGAGSAPLSDREADGASGAAEQDTSRPSPKNTDNNKRRRRSRRRRPDGATSAPAAQGQARPEAQSGSQPRPFTPPKDDRIPRRRHR